MTNDARPRLTALNLDALNDDVRTVLREIDEVVVYSLPMNIRFRGITRRDGLLLWGRNGWGEAAPFWNYDTQESSRWLRGGITTAVESFPQAVRSSVPVNVTIPACDVDTALKRVRAQAGCRTAKVKVAEAGQLGAEDIDRVRVVATELVRLHGSNARVRIDANAGWSVDEALVMLRELNLAAAPAGGLEYAEQPTLSVEELARLRHLSPVPIAADESVRRAADPLRVRQLQAADVAVLKVAPLGGIGAAYRLTGELGLPPVVSSALDSSVGIAAGVILAAALPNLNYACGLNTATMFTADVLADPFVAEGGVLSLERARATLNSELNPHSDRVDPDLVEAWGSRLEKMALAIRKADETR
ncbi:o-succinylbenzoate synthase [Actinomyces minihominis]|uniref:o-succinylbenzoate synthase n=1 Tax=Actinomyces minihominis TaxID=2002838 RepID=UPI001F5C7BC5|nr:o-succinylbenzoate synthase [Actinomyces minihominis]